MLAPDYLDHAPDRLVLLWQQVEDDITFHHNPSLIFCFAR